MLHSRYPGEPAPAYLGAASAHAYTRIVSQRAAKQPAESPCESSKPALQAHPDEFPALATDQQIFGVHCREPPLECFTDSHVAVRAQRLVVHLFRYELRGHRLILIHSNNKPLTHGVTGGSRRERSGAQYVLRELGPDCQAPQASFPAWMVGFRLAKSIIRAIGRSARPMTPCRSRSNTAR